MKKLMLSVLCVLCAGVVWGAGGAFTISGSVADPKGEALAMANVVLLQTDSTAVAATSSGKDGNFSFQAPAGSYKLVIRHIGYEEFSTDVELASDVLLPPVRMTARDVDLDAVTVNAQFITRRSDRFVMNVAGSTQAIGRTADEMLALAPGVWLTDEKLSINGREGTRVMVNERLLNMSTAEAIVYLKSIKAEDIQRIEVIPDAGADFDASSRGGIIKITLRRQREDGIEGSVSASGEVGARPGNYSFSPAFGLNYRRRALSLYTNVNYRDSHQNQYVRENTAYDDGVSSIVSSSRIGDVSRAPSFRLGGFYDLTDRQSIGLEAYYTPRPSTEDTDGEATFTSPTAVTRNRSDYTTDESGQNISVTGNYIWRIDSLGSVFKVIGDFYRRRNFSDGDFANSSATGSAPLSPDSLYTNALRSDYRVYSLSLAWEQVFSDRFTLKAGGKFAYNDMWDRTDYAAQQISSGAWYPLSAYSGVNEYTERISALYAIGDVKLFKKLSVSAGLRAEHTYATPKSAMGQNNGNAADLDAAKQDYLSLFPNLNVALPLNEKQSTQLIFAYSRKIERPGFWALNPFMSPMSRYSYVIGNPLLKPTFSSDISLTGVLGYKYTLTAGVSLTRNQISQVGELDPDNPDVFIYQFVNVPNQSTYFVNLNMPLNPYKWWDMNVNVTGASLSNDYAGTTRRGNGIFSRLNTTFTLPAAFALELTGWGSFGKMYSGNMEVATQWGVDAGLKKRFLKNRVTTSFTVNNLLGNRTTDITMAGAGFVKHTYVRNNWNGWARYNLSIRYNFKSGISFKAKKVESGSEEESSRINK